MAWEIHEPRYTVGELSRFDTDRPDPHTEEVQYTLETNTGAIWVWVPEHLVGDQRDWYPLHCVSIPETPERVALWVAMRLAGNL